jgi:two-component system LytT family response regulator
MIKAVIIDDQPAAGEVIETLLSAFSREITVSSVCRTIPEAVEAIAAHDPGIIFLDVELADGSGFEVLEAFPSLQARVIFVTAYEHFALKAIKHNAFEYILKPVAPDEFGDVVRRALQEIGNTTPQPDMAALLRLLKEPQKIAVPDRHGLQYYTVDSIVLLEAQGNYTEMHLASGAKPVLVSRLIKDFEAILAGKGFLRVHKSFLVNLSHVSAYRREDSGCLVMSNGRRIPISPRDKETILSRLKAASDMI